MRRLLLAILIGLVFASLLFMQTAWRSEEVHEFIEAIGVGLIAFGIIGRMWCTLYIGGRKSEQIVTHGPYSVTRNPLYVFSTIAAGGLGLQTGSLLVGLLFMVGCGAAFYIVILKEESFLVEKFGLEYESYRSSVPRFFPNIPNFSDKGELTIIPKKIYSTFFDGLVFFIAMPFLEYVEYLQETGFIVPIISLP